MRASTPADESPRPRGGRPKASDAPAVDLKTHLSRRRRRIALLVALGFFPLAAAAAIDRYGLGLFGEAGWRRYKGHMVRVVALEDVITLRVRPVKAGPAAPGAPGAPGRNDELRIRLAGVQPAHTAKNVSRGAMMYRCLGRVGRLSSPLAARRDPDGAWRTDLTLLDPARGVWLGPSLAERAVLAGAAEPVPRRWFPRRSRLERLSEQARIDKAGVWSRSE